MPFFNKIRKDQIKSEGMKRYFLYAIGEILVGIIGLQLTLQIENRN